MYNSLHPRWTIDSTTTNAIRLINTTATGTGRPAISFVNSAGGITTARISSQPGGSYQASELYFDVADSAGTLQTRMTIDGESFGFGLVNEVSREQYVLAGGAVHTVHVRYGTALPGAAADMASRQLFAPSEMPVRIELKDFTVASRDGRWVLTPAPAEDLSQDDFNRWVDGWRRAIALRVEPYTRIRPQGEIKVELKDGAKLTLVILGRGADLALARSDEKLIYTFVSDVAKRLLSPPGAGVRSETADKK